MRRALAVLLCVAVVAPGCASARGRQASVTQPSTMTAQRRPAVGNYVARLPIGSRVRASLDDGRTIRGTVLEATDEHVVIQPRTRIPEPPIDIAVGRIESVEIETPSGLGRAIAAGAAAGAGAALGVFLLLIAIYSD